MQPETKPHWSYSSLNQLLNICSLQWFFQRVEKRKPAFTPLPLAFGSSFHQAVEWFNRCRLEDEIPAATVVADLFGELWDRKTQETVDIEYPEGSDAGQVSTQGRAMIAHYVENVDNEEHPVSVNEPFSLPVPTSEKVLIGEFDLIIEKADRKFVVDQKTSARRWPRDQADKSLQATCYAYAFRRMYPGHVPTVVFDVIVKNKTPVYERHTTMRSQDDEKRLEQLIAQADRIVDHEVFYPSEQSFSCSGCPFQEPCRAWHRKQARTYSFAA